MAGKAKSTEQVNERRAVEIRVAGQPRLVPVEYAARYRDALGVPLPLGLPTALLAPAPNALSELLMRYARTHAPFTEWHLAHLPAGRKMEAASPHHALGARGT